MQSAIVNKAEKTVDVNDNKISLFHTEVLKQYGSRLSDYEKQEIEKYPEIWYLGLDACKINAKPGTPLNCGYDDENGSYNKVSLNINFSIHPSTSKNPTGHSRSHLLSL